MGSEKLELRILLLRWVIKPFGKAPLDRVRDRQDGERPGVVFWQSIRKLGSDPFNYSEWEVAFAKFGIVLEEMTDG